MTSPVAARESGLGAGDFSAFPSVPPPRRARIDSVDLLRGIVMVIMLLDHTRDFVHSGALAFDPTDLTRTWPALFFTRWITHFCAPVFVFLAGTGAYFQITRGKSRAELSHFLWTRGLWLVFLEFTVVNFLVQWNVSIEFLGVGQVIWAIGVSMIVLAALIHLPLPAIAAFGILMIALHNLVDPVRVAGWSGPGTGPGLPGSLWVILHQGGVVQLAGSGPVLFFLYPLIPWVGVMAAGYAFGSIYERPPEARKRWLLTWGAGITVGFVLLRALNIYGDPADWGAQATAIMTVVSFLNLQKYPPSLLYLMMTLGPALLALAIWVRYDSDAAGDTQSRGGPAAWLITFGRVPLFFYILQWVYAHTAGLVLSLLAAKPTGIFFGGVAFGQPPPPDTGFGLPVVYGTWIVGVVLLYPLCRWFAGVKARRRDWWLSYL